MKTIPCQTAHRSRSQQNLTTNKKKKEKADQNVAKNQVIKQDINSNEQLEQFNQSTSCISSESQLPIKKLDPNKASGTPELLVLTIKTHDKIIEATIREDTNLTHLNELISLFGDFKSYPKKFKEIFYNYLRT